MNHIRPINRFANPTSKFTGKPRIDNNVKFIPGNDFTFGCRGLGEADYPHVDANTTRILCETSYNLIDTIGTVFVGFSENEMKYPQRS